MSQKIRRSAVFTFALSILMIFGVTACQWLVEDEPLPVSVDELDRAILGALVYLDDTQVRDRSGARSCRYDASDEGDGCLSDEPDISALLPMAPLLNQRIANQSGEWSSFIYHLPDRFRVSNLPFLRSQDSNLFVTAFVAYPLLLFESVPQGADASPIEHMLDLAIRTIQGYRRQDGYSFWPIATSVQGGEMASVVPMNVPMATVEQFASDFLDPESSESVRSLFGEALVAGIGQWVEEVMTNPDNTQGVKAVFNVPNDADDTALALGLLKLYSLRHNGSSLLYDPTILRQFGDFRDVDRTREDGRDAYKGVSSGAFLTWLRDEDEPLFQDPSKGVIPLGVNNVDAVVNANVLLALSLHGARDVAGYHESVTLLDRVVRERNWPAAALYYPQRMMFPYALTRAYRDGGADQLGLREAIKILMNDLLQEQNLDPRHPQLYGSFKGASDARADLSTALACSALLNMGESIAIETGQRDAYAKALNAGIAYLLRNKEIYTTQNPETSSSWAPAPQGYRWGSDVIFSASFPQLVEWRSEAFSVAMVLEALAKYRVGYQYSNRPIAEAPSIRPMRPAHDAVAWRIAVADR